jgi:hypothetical protein
MEDDLETEDTNPGGAAALGGLDPQAQLATLFARYPAIEKQRQAERERIKAAKAARFEAARTNIEQQRFGAPTTRDKLFALSEALASPRYYGGLAGTMSRVAPVLGKMSQLQSSADAQRADAMRQLREQYEIGAEEDGLKALEAESAAVREQMKILAPLAKPADPFKGAVWSEEEGRWVMRPGTVGGPPVLTPEQAAQFAQNPKNKGMKFYTTDGRLLEIK